MGHCVSYHPSSNLPPEDQISYVNSFSKQSTCMAHYKPTISSTYSFTAAQKSFIPPTNNVLQLFHHKIWHGYSLSRFKTLLFECLPINQLDTGRLWVKAFSSLYIYFITTNKYFLTLFTCLNVFLSSYSDFTDFQVT